MWAELAHASVQSPNVSFVGHLAGILAGLLVFIVYELLQPDEYARLRGMAVIGRSQSRELFTVDENGKLQCSFDRGEESWTVASSALMLVVFFLFKLSGECCGLIRDMWPGRG